jgi:predicted nucleic acid-binding protein
VIVVDASLAVKWIIRETDTEAALRFLRANQGNLHAPDLFFAEVASAVVRRCNEGEMPKPIALRTLQKWSASWSEELVQRHFINSRRLLTAGMIALEMSHPIKDCIYLALAMEQDRELATCDHRFQKRAVALYPKVKLLRDYQA